VGACSCVFCGNFGPSYIETLGQGQCAVSWLSPDHCHSITIHLLVDG